MSRADRWSKLSEHFEELRSLTEEQRSTRLKALRQSDPALARELESLLPFAGTTPAPIDQRADEFLAGMTPRVAVGRRVGAYRIVERIGEGGMGVVWRAERTDKSFERQVVIKFLNRVLLLDEHRDRFRRERRLLAALDHPNVARLLDAGELEGAGPYIVMELVDGVPLDAYCSQNGLGVRARLELFCEVCDAVQAAHQELIVHRDIKPSNVLVTADGQPKLLDFGIAKLLEPDPSGDGQTATRLMTPHYASPEQIRGLPVSTATDVFQLGIVFYELLTARQPYGTVDDPAHEVQRAILEDNPPPLSQVSGTFPAARLRGDLDNIGAMALEKDQERRYASAARFAEDIRRHLGGLPVRARPATWGYRTRKFAGRHRWGVAATALLLATVLAGTGVTWRQALIAQRARHETEARYRDVRDLTVAMLFDFHDAIARLPGTTKARQLVLSPALENLERLSGASATDPILGREIALAYLRLGRVQGDPTGANLGDLSGARHSYGRALAIAQGLLDRDGGDQAARRTLALAHEKLGDVDAWTGQAEAGVEHARRALELFTALADAQPDDAGARMSQAISHVKLGDLLGNPNFPNVGDPEGSMEQYRFVLELLQAPPFEGATDSKARRYLGLIHERIGSMLRLEGAYPDALDAFLRSLAIREDLAREAGGSSDVERDLAVTHQNLCEVRAALHETTSAVDSCRKALAGYRELQGADPRNRQGLTDLAAGHESMYAVRAARDEWQAAIQELERVAELREEVLEGAPDNVPNRQALTRCLLRLSLAARRVAPRSGDAGRQAESYYRRGREQVAELRRRGASRSEEEELMRTVEDELLQGDRD